MACFTVPLAEAIVVTAIRHTVFAKKSNEARFVSVKNQLETLEKLLFGGSFLLAAEHIYHGEITLYPPFLTALSSPEEISVMLHEMATVGTGMAVLTTAVWAIIWGISAFFKKRKNRRLQRTEMPCA